MLPTLVIPPDSVRRAVEEVFARPDYQWTEGRRPLQWLRNLWIDFVEWLGRFGAHHPLGFKLLFWGAVLLLAAIMAHLAFVLWRIYRATVRSQPTVVPLGASQQLDAHGHGERAAELARAGRYGEALAHRFLALVLELDRLEAVRFHPSKTPAEYVPEARLEASVRESFADLVARLYRHVFGGAPCDAHGYEQFGATAGTVLQHVASR